ncbi:9166_t:CDS:1, partial [Gigaspora rosea]
MESEPYSMTQIENITNFEFLSDEDCEFIWGKVEKDTEYWFFE